MDYKEQIEELRFLSGHVPEQMCDADGEDPLKRAADALETLLAERDAAIADIERRCETCKHFLIFFNGCTPDYDCDNSECSNSGGNIGWEWRGTQDEEN